MKIKTVFVLNAAVVLLLLAACVPVPSPVPVMTPTAIVQPSTGIQYYYVTNKLLIPTSKEEAQKFALNLDGDSQQHPDNMFGDFLSLLRSAAPGLEVQATLDQVINDGQLVTLHLITADDALTDPSVSWSIFQGQKAQSAPKFDGADKFIIDPAAPVTEPIVGSLTNGHFSGGPGVARIQMFLMGQQVDVDLIGVRIESDLSASGCANGIIGGGLTDQEFRSVLLPKVADGLNQISKSDKDAANALMQAFDSDKNGTITTQELESNTILKIILSPDLDLLDADGKFNPGQDGVKDTYSMGLGFTCVSAVFTAPETQ